MFDKDIVYDKILNNNYVCYHSTDESCSEEFECIVYNHSIVEDMNYLYLTHISLVILRSTGAKHTLRSYSLL
jgi:hypothetical protein